MGIISRSTPGYGSNGLCTTQACIEIADDVLGNLALNHVEVDPCTNFDEYVCGNWAARNPVPAGASSVDVLGAIQSHVYELVRNVLEDPYPSGDDAGWITVSLTKEQRAIDKENFAKLQGAYEVCMNTTAQKEEGLLQLQRLAKTVVTKFPASFATGKTTGNNYTSYNHSSTMGETLAFFESLGIETTQRFFQVQDPKDPSKILLSVQPPTNPGSPSSPDAVPEYLHLASELLSSVHPANLTRGKTYTLMKSVMELQAALQSASAEQASPNITTESSDEYMSIAKIQQVAPQLNLEYVINQLTAKRFDRSRIGFSAPDFYRKLSQAISTTPAEVIQAFFVWKSIVSLSRYIDSPQTAAYNRFEAEQGGQDAGSPPPRWMRCAKLLDEGIAWIADDNTASMAVGPTGLTWILARFFADKNFTPEAKKLTSKIIDNLEEAFIGRIQTRAWATSKVKKAATEKVRAMANKIGLPTSPNAIDPHALKEFYGDINITPSLAQNVLSFAKSRISKNWASLGKPYDPSQFPSSTLTTNAFHEPQGNDMVILAGIQQSPLYNINYPAYITYGGMGSIVGHEITHGFDDNGRLYDKTGNQSSWFDDQSTEGFEKSAECFVNQYSKFVITGPDGKKEHIDGNLTLGENIADVGGVLSSFSAWKKWEGDNGKAQDLPGLGNFTHEQLFFVKWGQAWCENRKPEQVIAGLVDVHSPNSARILLPLENSVDFQRAFNCPQKKPVCELW